MAAKLLTTIGRNLGLDTIKGISYANTNIMIQNYVIQNEISSRWMVTNMYILPTKRNFEFWCILLMEVVAPKSTF